MSILKMTVTADRFTPEPETMESIRAANTDKGRVRKCGCSIRQLYGPMRTEWILCAYHEGYDDGVEDMKKKATPT